MNKTSRTKGRTYEQDVARRLRETFPQYGARRGWQNDGRPDAADVECGPFSVECKHRKAMNVKDHMQQAERQAAKGQYPVLAAKWHGGYELVAMLWEDWLELAADAIRWRERAA
jgi:hypothetical protein